MRLPNRKLLVRLGAAMFSALLAGFVFVPSPARAECGDYVMIGGRSAKDAGTMTSHGAAAQSTRASHALSDFPHDKHGPCSGPNCSRQSPPADPAPAPSARVRNGTENWGQPIATQEPIKVDSGRLIYEFTAAHSCHRAPAIFHPPR